MKSEFARWNEKVGGFIRAIGTPDLPRKLSSAIAEEIPFDIAMAFAYQGTQNPVCLYHNIDKERAKTVITAYAQGPYLLDPFYLAAIDPKITGVRHLRKMAPDQFYSTEYYRQHYGRTRIRDEIGVVCRPPGAGAVVISFTRPGDAPFFGRRDFNAMRAIEPVVRAVIEAHWCKGGAAAETTKRKAEDPINQTLDVMADGILTPREIEITSLILRGHSSRSIAETLSIAEGTVKIHRKNIYQKLGASSQSELFSMFIVQLSKQ
ncbi:helix-turn-helix domain-containing protein [Rhizobium cremeum]|uniref:helix-turn-helix transcriptional regulator n=1 Tax=Rhizobium cremeum TaxID=2813827 RepID=UPI000DDDB47F